MRRVNRIPGIPSSLADGRYELGDPLGSGGMAVVYRAYDRKDRKHCAIKVLLPRNAQNPKTRQRFQTEAATMARLDHGNIVSIFDVGEDDGKCFFVMELCPDGSVSERRRRERSRDPVEALDTVLQVLQGLGYAHNAGVVHRDIKPHNMLLTGGTVKLTDFGIARVVDHESSSRITGTGDTLGTLAYMSPEQRIDARKAGPTADIYGVGATLYIMATGRRPFDLAMASLDPTVLERVDPRLRPLVRRSTAHRPNDRYPNALAMAVGVLEAWEQFDPSFPWEQRLEDFRASIKR
jgi:eukaryotic-like serine/threonine-protein kinase